MLSKLDYLYNDGESILHRINPVCKYFGLFIYILLCFLKFDNFLFICNISFVFLLLLLSNVSFFKYLKIIWNFKYIIIFIYIFLLNNQMEFIEINIMMFKLMFFILYIAVIVFTTTKEDLGRGGSIVVNRFNFVGLSIKSISSFITDIFVFINIFIDNYNDIIINLEIKGHVYSHASIIDKIKIFFLYLKKVIKCSLDKMKDRKNDMKYKLYDNKVKSKYKYRNKLCIFDYIYVILNICMLVYYILKVR